MKLKTVAVAILLALVLIPCSAMAEEPAAAEPLKDFVFEGMDGKSFSTSELRGKPLVIIIAATWCPPCKREAPDLQKAYFEYKEKGVEFLGVFALSSDKAVKKFVKKYGLTFPVGKGDGIKEQFGWKSFPKAAFVDSKGIVKSMHSGELSYEELVEGIEEILE